ARGELLGRRAQDGRAVPDPGLALGGGERVEVEHGLPLGLVRAVGVEGRAAPDAALVLRVAPEAVVPVADLRDLGDLGVGVEHLADRALGRRERVAGLERRGDLGAPRPAPGPGLVAADVLEPQVGVVRRGVVGGDGLAGALGCAGGARRLRGGHGHPPYGDGARGGAEVTRAAGPWARAAAETLW